MTELSIQAKMIWEVAERDVLSLKFVQKQLTLIELRLKKDILKFINYEYQTFDQYNQDFICELTGITSLTLEDEKQISFEEIDKSCIRVIQKLEICLETKSKLSFLKKCVKKAKLAIDFRNDLERLVSITEYCENSLFDLIRNY
ncbi:unnamed protein product [Moneuplotes crassus]|uniref:Uncharacterized protein n=1 Tax=Euplotes crassus TaxID=5936 RepID=A0AAD1XY70_EUPCR|nr:unnamed protein product [Moneuplotes crassus]